MKSMVGLVSLFFGSFQGRKFLNFETTEFAGLVLLYVMILLDKPPTNAVLV